MKQILDAFNKLEAYIEKEEFKGYDPYDTLNSWIPFKLLGKWPAAIATQIQKRNPFNIRPLLGIKKEINPKAFGLFLQAYSLLYANTKNKKYLEKADYFFEWLNNNYSKGYSGYCWGYNFSWANPEHYYDAFTPSSVVTGFVVKGLWEYYKITKNKKVKNIIISASNFILKDIPVTEDKSGICFSYTPRQKDLCFNASLLAAEVIARTYTFTKEEILKKEAQRAVEWVIAYQKDDGRWNYSIDVRTGKENKQIDFHQGYVLESIYDIKNILSVENDMWELSLKKGLRFYVEKQFNKDGWSFWRLPRKYPVEIHNQSQGIITLIKLKEYLLPNYQDFVYTIAYWTIKNMQDKDGHFYYQKFKTHTHKISYMRWSNAWMFLALNLLMSVKIENHNN